MQNEQHMHLPYLFVIRFTMVGYRPTYPMKKSALCFLILPIHAFADSLLEQNRDPTRFQREDQAVQFAPNFAKNLPKPTAYLPSQNGQSLEAQINQAIVAQAWQTLERLLPVYAHEPNADPLLLDYAQAALAYAKQDHAKSIFYYRQLLAKKPELIYPRFDFALVLAENYQYREAEHELQVVYPQLSPEIQPIAARTLAQIAESEAWQPDVYLQYTQTNNVNNASSSPVVNVNGRIFRKDADSLPQSAKGVRYGLGVSKTHNLGGNHFAGVSLDYSGVYYWDQRDYREQSLSLSPHYRYRTARYQLGIAPFIEQNWLGSARYQYQFGVNLNGARQLNDKWSLNGNFAHTQKRYFAPLTASRYNGYQHQIGLGVQWQAVKNGRFFANLNGSRDLAQEKALSSNKWLASLGVRYQWQHWGVQASVGYGKCYFSDNHYLFGYKRVDKEYQANVSLWNSQWQWRGIMPKLNWRYQKIDSNIADFYSRQQKELFLSVEKRL